jgi:hypothetical protein
MDHRKERIVRDNTIKTGQEIFARNGKQGASICAIQQAAGNRAVPITTAALFRLIVKQAAPGTVFPAYL